MNLTSICNRQALIFAKKYIQLDKCNSQVIIFKVSLLDCSQSPLFAFICLCACILVCLLVYLLSLGFCIQKLCLCVMCFMCIMSLFVLNVLNLLSTSILIAIKKKKEFICFNYVLYDLFSYNKCMTSSHQSNASCGHSPLFFTSPTLVKTCRNELVQCQTLQTVHALESHACVTNHYISCIFSIFRILTILHDISSIYYPPYPYVCKT